MKREMPTAAAVGIFCMMDVCFVEGGAPWYLPMRSSGMAGWAEAGSGAFCTCGAGHGGFWVRLTGQTRRPAQRSHGERGAQDGQICRAHGCSPPIRLFFLPFGRKYRIIKTENIVGGCAMCKRMIINAGISRVVIRDDKEHWREIAVSEWVENDDSMTDVLGY